MSAAIIPLVKATSTFAARTDLFNSQPTVDELIARSQASHRSYFAAEKYYYDKATTDQIDHHIHQLWIASEFFWERCLDHGIEFETVLKCLNTINADKSTYLLVTRHRRPQ